MKPRSLGGSRSRRHPHAPLAIDHGFLCDEADMDVLTEGSEQLRALGGANSLPRVNTNLTTAAIAEKLAETI
jgi:hypothetical protein